MTHGPRTGASFEMAAYYVSDVHLEFQLAGRHPDRVGDARLLRSVDEFVEDMVVVGDGSRRTAPGECLLVAGDVASTPRLTKRFYRRCSELFTGGLVIGVLGNHELWGYATPEKAVEKHRAMLDGVVLLENELFVCHETCATSYPRRTMRHSGDEVLSMGDDELRSYLRTCSLIVLGGLGYTGCEPVWNASRGIYRTTVTTIEEDRARSERFERLHEKVRRCAGDLHVIVLTHTPIESWTRALPQPSWSYVFGHTHADRYQRLNGADIYADNQIGYDPVFPTLKRFFVQADYEVLRDLPDGIHPISDETYIRFLRGRGIQTASRALPGQVYALKREGLYMFVLETDKALCILDGGARRRLEAWDKAYYYENMVAYARQVEESMRHYNERITQIADAVRAIGGSGTRHGCIVDVDWCNHVYLNPYDGTVTPYWASDTENKYVYASFRELLACERRDLLRNCLGAGEQALCVLEGESEATGLVRQPELVLDKLIYGPSRIMRKVQYLVEDGVIRIWKDGIVAGPPKLPRPSGPKPLGAGPSDRRVARRSPDEAYAYKVDVLSDGELVVDLTSYKGSASSVRVTCRRCGSKWNPIASDLLANCRCPRCSRRA